MRRPQRLGVRREILILLPATLLLLVLISTFTLLSLRSALQRWQEERCDEAAAIAGRLVRQIGGEARPLPSEADLARLAEPVRALGGSLAVLDSLGTSIVQTGPFSGLGPAGRTGDGARSWGPLQTGGDFVAARVPLRGAGRILVVELPAEALASQLRSARWLGWVVLPVNTALLLLALFSLQQILGPWERLLARAEQIGGARAVDQDEIDFLLSTFEQALASTPQPAEPTGEDDLAALDRTLSPSLQSGLLLLGRQGEVLALNDLGAALLGVPAFRPGVSPGPNVRELLAGRPEVLALIIPAIQQESGAQREELSIEGSGAGSRRTVLGLSVHPLRRVDGGVRGHLVLFTDLTDVRLRREQARVAEGLSQLGEMAAGVAHELRNGLATLRGYLTLIDRKPTSEAVGDYLAEVRREADHLERVASDFLEFARPGSARLQPVPLGDLLRRAAGDPALGGLAVVLSGDLELTAAGDEPLLSRAFRNLLLNAAEAERRNDGQGPLEIEARPLGEGLISIEIRDRGPGVPAEIRDRLYQPFVTGRAGGVGLGLALAYRIVSLHGGTLELADREGGGTVALLTLPAA